MRATPTIHDVARASNVSIGTVSKALNNIGSLRQETRERIATVAEAIGYRPNDLAQSLHRARSMTVGILSNDSFGRFAFPIVEALERRLSDHGIAVFMCNATDDPMRERRHIDQLLGKRVDGLVVTARRADRRALRSSRPRSACRWSMRSPRSRTPTRFASCRTTRAARGLRSAISPLSAARRSPILPGRNDSRRFAYANGPRKALVEAGLKAGESDCRPGQWSEAWGREAVQTLFRAWRGAPDALFVATTRSREAPWMRCARWDVACLTTWPWSGSTIGA